MYCCIYVLPERLGHIPRRKPQTDGINDAAS